MNLTCLLHYSTYKQNYKGVGYLDSESCLNSYGKVDVDLSC